MFCALRLIFIGTEGLESRINIFCSRTRFGGTAGDESRFHVLRSWTRFQRYRDRRVPFSCLAHLESFLAISRASGLVFLFRAPEHIFGGIVGVGSFFHVLHCQTRFRQNRGRQVSFLCFDPPNSFAVVPRASGPVFMFYAPGLIFGGSESIRCSFHVLRSRTRFRRYSGRRVPLHI
jgi:hypothetical protein